MISSRWIVVALVMGVTDAGPALADFRVVTSAQSAASDIPHIQPEDLPRNYIKFRAKSAPHSIINIMGRASVPKNRLNDDLVEGFGAAVPLAFACRQILPKTIKVVYGQGVDAAIPVNWTGGRGWAAVLRDAIQPAGLKLVPHGGTVEIRK